VLTACLCLAGATGLGVGACGTTGSNAVTVSSKNLTIYVSAPANLKSDPVAQDVIDAEKLALSQLSSTVHGFTLRLRVLTADKISDNARTAIKDTTSAVAYLGEIVPGDSADSIGITNDQDLLQVSPTDTALELTQSTPAIPGAPDRYYQALSTYGRTFARMVPNSSQEARAVVAEIKTLGVTSLDVENDGSEYGRALAHAVTQDFGGSTSGAPTVFYAGTPSSTASKALDSAAAAHANAKLFASSGLDNDTFVSGLSPQAQHDLYVSAPGFAASSLSATGQKFVSDFRTLYRRAPSTQAIFGYAAMQAVLDALSKAGSGATNRTTVKDKFFGLKNQSSVLGMISIGQGGDITITSPSSSSSPPFVFLRVIADRLVLPPAGHP
jgi:ABC-type branched-subunit amino acid transport system substrate-binding protein